MQHIGRGKRIVYLSASGTIGGAERCLLDLFAAIRGAAPDWSLHLVLGCDGPLRDRALALGVPSTIVAFPDCFARLGEWHAVTWRRRFQMWTRLITAGPSLTTYAWRLRRTLTGLAPDVVHSNALKMHVLAGFVTPKPAAVIWHLHDFVGRRPVTRRLLRLSVRRCSTIVTNSAAVAADVRSVLTGTATIRPVPNGVDLDVFSPMGRRLDLDGLAGLPPVSGEVVRVGLVGTMARWKGHTVFLQALASLAPTSSIRAYVVGGPIYQTEGSQYSLAELHRHAAALGLTGRIGFTGIVDDSAAAMRALDIVVHASTAPEPFGLVVAEAMACGRPVVMSAASGIADYLMPERDVLTFPSGDVTALAARIEELAGDPSLRAALGTQARATAVARFDRRRLAEELIPIYRGIGAVSA